MSEPKLRIALIATGLGITNRGFETSALQWARALRKTHRAEVLLLSGGRHTESTAVLCIRQSGCFSKALQRLSIINDGARLQQRTFAPFAKERLREFKPDFVWLQEGSLAESLQEWIRSQPLSTKLVFCNGAPLGPGYCSQFDLVIDLISTARQMLLDTGFPPIRSCLIPHIIDFPATNPSPTWRISNGYANNDRIIICVAAWNSHHKRIDYILREVACARRYDPRLKLLLCGQPTREAKNLQLLGRELLGSSVRWMTLQFEDLISCYYSSDLFVLASTNEAFGAVLAEAAIAGLPILSNDFPSAHFILGNNYPGIIDMSQEGALAEAILDSRLLSSYPDISQFTRNRFSPHYLADRLLSFLESSSR